MELQNSECQWLGREDQSWWHGYVLGRHIGWRISAGMLNTRAKHRTIAGIAWRSEGRKPDQSLISNRRNQKTHQDRSRSRTRNEVFYDCFVFQ